MGDYLEALRQNPVGVLVGPIALLLGFGLLWLWLRRQNRRSAADAVAVILAALLWVAAMLPVFAKPRLSRGETQLIAAGVTVACWFVFNRLSSKRGNAK